MYYNYDRSGFISWYKLVLHLLGVQHCHLQDMYCMQALAVFMFSRMWMWITFTSRRHKKPHSSKLLEIALTSNISLLKFSFSNYTKLLLLFLFTETRSPKSPQVRSLLLQDNVTTNVPDDSSKQDHKSAIKTLISLLHLNWSVSVVVTLTQSFKSYICVVQYMFINMCNQLNMCH